MTFKLAILTAAALSAAPALAQTAYAWETVGSMAGMTLYYNPLTVSRADGVVGVTVKLSGAANAALSVPNPATGQNYNPSYYVERMSIACGPATYADLENTGYDAQGNQLYKLTNVHGMVPIADSPVAQAMQTKLCK